MRLDSAKALVMHHEGVRKRAYDDATGKVLKPNQTLKGRLTIGYGRNLTDRDLADSEIEMLLNNALRRCQREGEKLGPWWQGLNAPRRAVIVDCLFCLGRPRFLRFRKMRAALAVGDYQEASVQLLDSKFGRTHGTRVLRLAEILRRGEYLDE